jgi:hypothetical protein
MAILLLLAAGLGAYASHAIVDEREFADRAESALERPAVRDEVALRLRDRDAALALQAPGFGAAFRESAERMHAALFDSRHEEVSLELASASLVSLGGGGALERELRGAAPAAGRVAGWWPVALLLALLAAGSLRRAGLALAVAGGLTAATILLVELALLQTFTSAHGDAVVDAIWDSYLGDLVPLALAAALLGLGISWLWRPPAPARRRAGASSPAGSSTTSPR